MRQRAHHFAALSVLQYGAPLLLILGTEPPARPQTAASKAGTAQTANRNDEGVREPGEPQVPSERRESEIPRGVYSRVARSDAAPVERGPWRPWARHHDDAVREYAYDRQSHFDHLDKAWDEALAKHWTVVRMKDDWKTIFPPETGK